MEVKGFNVDATYMWGKNRAQGIWWDLLWLLGEHKFCSFINTLHQYLHIYNIYIAHFKCAYMPCLFSDYSSPGKGKTSLPTHV